MLKSAKKGFTIIEVVIVLVIGAIIMLMVFLVVPALQRSQRDARRQSDARRWLAGAEQYATNNDNSYPSANQAGIDAVKTSYIQDTWKDPTTDATYVYAAAVPKVGEIQYLKASTCDKNVAKAATGNNKISVVVFQEAGGTFCVAN